MRVSEGETIFKEGDAADLMFVVLEGRVQIVKHGTAGDAVLATLGQGAFFGEMAILEQTTRSASAIAASDATLMVIDAADLGPLLRSRPDIGENMIRALVRRLAKTNSRLMDEKSKLAMLFEQEDDRKPARHRALSPGACISGVARYLRQFTKSPSRDH